MLAGIDHQGVQTQLGERGAQALEQHAGTQHLRVADHRHKTGPGCGEQPPQAMGLILRHGAHQWMALRPSASGAPAKIRLTSALSMRQAPAAGLLSARCTSAALCRRCQSSGTRWPLATPSTLSLWRISVSSAGASLTASSILLSTTPSQAAAFQALTTSSMVSPCCAALMTSSFLMLGWASISSNSWVRLSRWAMPAVSISTSFLLDSSSSRSSSEARSCAVCTGTPRMRP
mmetsp:Transcript_29004/g.52464  ORF Transcript_29004/g.52464 Transcript_29004/m.52464 type:complete len:232 (+) Transcript_29004:75-770(+)